MILNYCTEVSWWRESIILKCEYYTEVRVSYWSIILKYDTEVSYWTTVLKYHAEGRVSYWMKCEYYPEVRVSCGSTSIMLKYEYHAEVRVMLKCEHYTEALYWIIILKCDTEVSYWRIYSSCVPRTYGCAGPVDAVEASGGGGVLARGDADAEGGHHKRGSLHEAARRARRGPHAWRHRQIALRGALLLRY